jgi:hypothetical protein
LETASARTAIVVAVAANPEDFLAINSEREGSEVTVLAVRHRCDVRIEREEELRSFDKLDPFETLEPLERSLGNRGS